MRGSAPPAPEYKTTLTALPLIGLIRLVGLIKFLLVPSAKHQSLEAKGK